MNIGILQGRLSPPNGGFQEFPKDWKKYFVDIYAFEVGSKSHC